MICCCRSWLSPGTRTASDCMMTAAEAEAEEEEPDSSPSSSAAAAAADVADAAAGFLRFLPRLALLVALFVT